jgi:hypothetical protein
MPTVLPLFVTTGKCKWATLLLWDSTVWTKSEAVLLTRMTDGVILSPSVRLLHSEFNARNITMTLRPTMQELDVLVKFDAQGNASDVYRHSWCDDIEVLIDYDTERTAG